MALRLSSEIEEAILGLVKTRMATIEIAEKLGIATCTVRRVCIRNDIPPRTGMNSPQWTGGKNKDKNGYIRAYVPPGSPAWPMRRPNGRCLEHRLVMAEHLGRPLTAEEQIHHVNGNKTDNRIENLQLIIRCHGSGVAYECCDCGSTNISPKRILKKDKKHE